MADIIFAECYSNYLNAYFFKEIAVSPNNNVVNIYEKKGKGWVKIHELTEHSGRITGKANSKPTDARELGCEL